MLRPLDAFAADNPSALGQKLLALSDPSGIAPAMLTLPPLGAAVIDLCDGTRTRAEICAEFAARYRRPLPPESLAALLDRLDAALMLDSLHFRMHSARLFADFSAAETRPARWAGNRYPEDAAALTKLLTQALAPPNGPGEPPAALRPDAPAAPHAILVPCVDIERGGPAYAWGYRPLLDAPKLPDLIVLFGCDHGGYDPVLSLTRKHLATPLGTLATDVELVEQIIADANAKSEDLAELLLRDEFHHRAEHALEFQAVWLSYVLGSRKRRGEEAAAIKILPILCGSLHELASAPLGRDPDGQNTNLIEAVVPLIQQRVGERVAQGRSVLWLCAADLAHVGPRFGDAQPLSDDDRDSLERRDRATLKSACAGDAQGFLAEIRRERDRRRIIGLGAIYTWLRAACPSGGQLRCYAQCAVEAGSYVSAATLVYP